MSRIGNRKLEIPAGVTVTVLDNVVTVKGAKGELSLKLTDGIKLNIEENGLTVETSGKTKFANAMHGTTNSLIKNMIKGVSEGYSKGLEIIGVGYRFQVRGNVLVVNAGYSHPVEVAIPQGLTIETVSNTEITVNGIDKELNRRNTYQGIRKNSIQINE